MTLSRDDVSRKVLAKMARNFAVVSKSSSKTELLKFADKLTSSVRDLKEF